MSTTTGTQRPLCQCGCGRELRSHRGDGHGYANACRKRWHRQGCPPGGPQPARRARAADIDARLDQLETLFAGGRSYAEAAEEMGLTFRQVEHYAATLNKRKRERGSDGGAGLRPARPLPAVTHWTGWAACREHENLFFGPDGERLADRQVREEQAKLLCGVCPVIADCGEFAQQHQFRDGVWAGVSETDREQAKRDQKNASRRVAARREQDAGVAA